MTDDIVTRLHEEIDSVKVDVQVLRDAISEIERLQDELVRTRAERDCAQIQADHLAERLVKEASRG